MEKNKIPQEDIIYKGKKIGVFRPFNKIPKEIEEKILEEIERDYIIENHPYNIVDLKQAISLAFEEGQKQKDDLQEAYNILIVENNSLRNKIDKLSGGKDGKED
jgi:hypothetical protein